MYQSLEAYTSIHMCFKSLYQLFERQMVADKGSQLAVESGGLKRTDKYATYVYQRCKPKASLYLYQSIRQPFKNSRYISSYEIPA